MGNSNSSKPNSLEETLSSGKGSRKIEEKYDVKSDNLGRGASTEIKLGESKNYSATKNDNSTHTKTTRTKGVAIKLYDGKSEIPPDLRLEAEILRECDHPNIVKLYEVSKAKHKKQISLVMELCTGGCIRDRLPYTEKDAAHIMKQLCSAVSYLHGKNIVHRDIELSNILFEQKLEDDQNMTIKLIDFGCATKLELVPNQPGAFKFLKEKTGSVHTMAPEVIQGKYGPKADVWSLGVVAYMLLQNGEQPFKGSTVLELESKIIQGNLNLRTKAWQQFSSASKQFIQDCMVKNSGQRMPSSSAYQHDWITTMAKRKSSSSLSGLADGPSSLQSTNTIPNDIVVSFDLYRLASPLKRIGLYSLARKLAAGTQTRHRELFERLNKSNSGAVSYEEFQVGFKNSGHSQEELKDLFEKLDLNRTLNITYTEFLAATLEAQGELDDDQLQEAFDSIDVERTGYITKKNLKKLLSTAGIDYKSSDGVDSAPKAPEPSSPAPSRKHGTRSSTSSSDHIIEAMLNGKDRMDFDEFAELFEHGFDARRDIDTIVETSLNAEQLDYIMNNERSQKLMSPIEE